MTINSQATVDQVISIFISSFFFLEEYAFLLTVFLLSLSLLIITASVLVAFKKTTSCLLFILTFQQLASFSCFLSGTR